MAARARKSAVTSVPDAAPAGKATPAELAAYLRKSKGTIDNWRSQGKGPHWTKPGGSILYDWADVYAWEKSQPSGGEDIRRGAA